MDVHIELQVIPVKLVARVVQQIIRLALHVIHDHVKGLQHAFQTCDWKSQQHSK